MKRTVYKVALPEPGKSYRAMFRGGFIPVHVAMQRNLACLWFEVHINELALQDLQEVELFCVGTGHLFPDDGSFHLGTILDGEFVWHYYARFV